MSKVNAPWWGFALCACLVGCGSDQASDKKSETAHAGSGGAPSAAAGSGGSAPDAGASAQTYPDPRGQCDLHSNYDDDHACILPPDPSEGFQIHVGPSNYDDPDEVSKFILHPGEERSECWTFHTPNDQKIFYQSSVLSGRAGTHHIIITMFSEDMQDGGFGTCNEGEFSVGMDPNVLGTLPGASKPYMPRRPIAPENAHIAQTVPPHATSQADMHYYNLTDHDILREFWLNIYYADPDQITDQALQIRGMGGFSWTQNPIPPGTDMVYKYACPISGNGRILQLLGHYHAHGKRETATITRTNGDVQKVFEMYDYLEPAIFDYDSVTSNPDFSDTAAGAVSGMLEVHDGDVLGWECHIVNDSNVGLKYINAIQTGEMCNLWGTSFGIDKFDCLKP